MKQWSKFFQNEEFLEKTRMFILNEDMRDYVIDKNGLKPGLKVLDVGCGSGEYTWYLMKGTHDVDFTGLDYDEDFVKAAQARIPEEKNGCSFRFVQGDAKAMPFPDESFDIVVSHTFFNSMPAYKEAMKEMIRVCKTGGMVSSISSTDLQTLPHFTGLYPQDADYWKKPYDELLNKVYKMYETVAPFADYVQGIPTDLIPAFFARNHLAEVSAYPIGCFFSLSNHAFPKEKKKRYIELDYIAEKKRLTCVYEQEEAKACMTEEEVAQFLDVLEQRRDYLLANIDENRIWEWQSGTSLLVTGRKQSENDLLLNGLFAFLNGR
ncbi:MAG: class I SAM-dependent methyltransferase [Lachnospiraceae bacterium]|nr:class I SAM-dependent methyltransferase [Lachnospiraceae bacterium]